MAPATLGFIGLGVIGAPMCRNLAAKSAARELAARGAQFADAPVARTRQAVIDRASG